MCDTVSVGWNFALIGIIGWQHIIRGFYFCIICFPFAASGAHGNDTYSRKHKGKCFLFHIKSSFLRFCLHTVICNGNFADKKRQEYLLPLARLT